MCVSVFQCLVRMRMRVRVCVRVRLRVRVRVLFLFFEYCAFCVLAESGVSVCVLCFFLFKVVGLCVW